MSPGLVGWQLSGPHFVVLGLSWNTLSVVVWARVASRTIINLARPGIVTVVHVMQITMYYVILLQDNTCSPGLVRFRVSASAYLE